MRCAVPSVRKCMNNDKHQHVVDSERYYVPYCDLARDAVCTGLISHVVHRRSRCADIPDSTPDARLFNNLPV